MGEAFASGIEVDGFSNRVEEFGGMGMRLCVDMRLGDR